MGIKSGRDQQGQLVWKFPDDTIVPVRILVDSDGNIGSGAVIGGIVLVDPNDNLRKAIFDHIFSVPVIQSIGHYMIHKGLSFERHISSNNAAVPTLNVAFKTLPGTKLAHMLFGFDMSDETQIEIIEGATWSQGSGAALGIFAINRNIGGNSVVLLEDKNQSIFTASNQVIKDVTGINGGTNIDPDRFTYNAGLGASISAETREAAHEWPLKNDTTYIVRMTQTGGNCKMTIDLHWYEK